MTFSFYILKVLLSQRAISLHWFAARSNCKTRSFPETTQPSLSVVKDGGASGFEGQALCSWAGEKKGRPPPSCRSFLKLSYWLWPRRRAAGDFSLCCRICSGSFLWSWLVFTVFLRVHVWKPKPGASETRLWPKTFLFFTRLHIFVVSVALCQGQI